MLKAVELKIEEIYLTAERRKALDTQKVERLAEQIMEGAEEQPVHVRQGKGRYVLVKGVNRLEARRALGEESIQAYIVGAHLH